jgi:uncharacterized protein
MSRSLRSERKSRTLEAREMFERAYREWKRKNVRVALRLFVAAAEAGDKGAQVNVGYFYDKGIGIRPNRMKALYWYKRAYRRGDAGAANNIGTIWRDQNNMKLALTWFEKAVKLGEDGSNLEIAKYYLRVQHDPEKAIGYLNKVCRSDRVAAVELEEANRLLNQARKMLKRGKRPGSSRRLN